ncbi:rhodanese-like domain-containing protein [Oxalobacteraceae bacterium OM1]|nr:rhodanese-like domain-containing protein [Oxalobacteraceae bacterium OM1]
MKFLIDNIWLIGLALLSGGALAWPSLKQRGQRITLLQATQLLNQNKAVVIDVRSKDDYAAGHLRDARNIPLAELSNRTGELEKLKGKRLITVCQTGVASARAVAILKKAGFTDAASLEGGIAAWQAQNLPLTK